MPKTTVPTGGYDDAGNMTVYELAPGETLPPGVHDRPPPGTHPHERELAPRPRSIEDIAREATKILEEHTEFRASELKPYVPELPAELHPLDIPEPLRRPRGRPPKPRL